MNLNNIMGISDELEKTIDGGIILTEDRTLPVIRINEKWFTIKIDIKPYDILCSFVNPELAQHLIWKTKQALSALKKANKYSDTEHLNQPIRLVRHQAQS